MSVYVDDMYKSPMGAYRGMKMSHMIADSTEELIEMAEKIGVNVKWIQHKGTFQEHFDIAFSKRELAVKAGAIEITMRELGRITWERMKNESKNKENGANKSSKKK